MGERGRKCTRENCRGWQTCSLSRWWRSFPKGIHMAKLTKLHVNYEYGLFIYINYPSIKLYLVGQIKVLIMLLFFFNFFYLTLQDCIGFAIYQNESATGIHVFPILNPSLLPPHTIPLGRPSAVSKSCLTLAIPWSVACQAPLSMGFSRQEYGGGVPLPSLITLYTRQQKRH